MGGDVHHHRPTLKQTNKPFKSKHATKSALKDASKGKVQRKSPKAVSASNSTAAQLRANRRNAAKQAQNKKRQALVSSTRLFSGVDGAPRIVAVVPLSEDVDARTAASALAESLDADTGDCPEHGLWTLRAERFKTSLQFINLPYRHLYATLDACKAADYVLLVLSTAVEVDAWGDVLLRTLQAQGLPTVVACAAPPSGGGTAPAGVLKSLLSFVQYFVPAHARVFDLAARGECTTAARTLCEGAPGDVRWRAGRAWVLGEAVRWEPREPAALAAQARGAAGDGVLCVTGVVRGAPLSADRLVHIPGHGDVQIEKIVSAPLPRRGRGGVGAMEVEPVVLVEPTADDADSLVSTNDPDTLANEQTWPTEEEMRGARLDAGGAAGDVPDARVGTTPKRIKRVPKGTSEYQAAWIVDDDDDDGDVDGGDASEDADGDVDMNSESNEGAIDGDAEDDDDEEMVDMPVHADEGHVDIESGRRSVAFMDMDVEEESRQLAAWRSRTREEEEDGLFPDELDTPKDTPARTRFQRYRGLRSFRTSPWDPFENLPRDYARIFQFEDFKRTERNVRRRAEQDGAGVEPGTRVTVYLKGAAPEAASHDLRHPFIMLGLLQHEHKVSVLNFTVQRNTEHGEPVRSKDSLILCVGPRRLRVNPVFSQHTRGGGKGANNVHKFERWLRPGVTSVATTYGPVVFGNQPCVLLKETADPQAPHLVAMGTFLNTDTTRVIAKRIILTGHPFKVHKKTATVRYMFFNQEDVTYFAPVQLHTKHGRTGHIKESLGTHGYFKAHFDGPINQMDTVCMSLYKRVYPKWPQLWTQRRENESSAPLDVMEV